MENGEPTHHNIKDLFNVKGYIHNSKIVLTSIILLIFVVVLILFIHLYARWFLLRARRRHRRHFLHQSSDDFIFYLDSNDPSTLLTSLPSRGLHTSVISLLPVFNYDPDTNSDDPPECAVCLSEFEEGETGRVLPKCNHVFHIDCIDMWFHSHPTCPLCRSLVEAPPEDNLPDIVIELSESDPDSSSASEENQIGGEDSKPSSEEDVIVEVDGFRDESNSVSDSPST